MWKIIFDVPLLQLLWGSRNWQRQDKHNPLTTWILPYEFSILYIVAIDIVEKD
jgi:hypothetical protein